MTDDVTATHYGVATCTGEPIEFYMSLEEAQTLARELNSLSGEEVHVVKVTTVASYRATALPAEHQTPWGG